MSVRLQKSSTLCTSQINNSSQLKPLLMAQNSSLGENLSSQNIYLSSSSSENRSQQNHLAPPPIAPDSPRPQKSEQSPLASVGLTIPLPNAGANTNKK